jgi:dCTP deaminase
MILNELEIARRLSLPRQHRQRLIITPIINPRKQFNPASFDVRLGIVFQVIRESRLPYLTVNPRRHLRRLEQNLASSMDEYVLSPGEKFVLHPNEFVLGSTLEYIQLPDDIAGVLEGRSSWGRFGLQVHSTAGFIDPGFAGNLTFELENLGSVPLSLPPGLRIGQIEFIKLSGTTSIPYHSKAERKYHRSVGTIKGALYDPREKSGTPMRAK